MPSNLPEPDDIALRHSRELVMRICEQVAAVGGGMAFDRFMEMALYEPELGYYTGGSQKFGAAGDFITAPESSYLFSHCMAAQVGEVLERTGGGDVLEFGAGSGALAVDMLQRLSELDRLPDRYFILEVSASLRGRQQEVIKERLPDVYERIHWLDGLPEEAITGVVVANEVLDAFPVTRFRLRGGAVEVLGIGCDGGNLYERWIVAPDGVREAVQDVAKTVELTDGFTSEVSLRTGPWLEAVGSRLLRGMLLVVDYGFPRREYYHSQRRAGTLQCHFRHRVHDNPLYLPGIQDITAHVDFTAVAHAAVEAGFSVDGFVNQAQFLIGCGLDQLLTEAQDRGAGAGIQAAQQAKRLVLPTEMGERFKVMGLAKSVDGPWRGFLQPDLRARL